ncbi:MAG: pilus assembly protein PilM [Pseudomonadota bacterium]
MAQRVVGLDVGTHSIKVVHLAVSMRTFNVTAYYEEPVQEEETADSEPRAYFDRVGDALRALKTRGALTGDMFITGLPGDVATTRLVRLPFSDTRRIDATLRYEVEAQVPYDLDDMVMTNSVLSGQVDKKTDVLVGLAKKTDVATFLNTLKSVGVDPRHVELDALALDDLYRHLLAPADEIVAPAVTPGGTAIAMGPDAYTPATAIVDIGHRRTAICIMADDQVVTARTLIRGGSDLTRSLAKAFHLPLDQAEQGKLREAYLEVSGEKAPYPEQERISQALKSALQPVVRELRQSFQSVVALRRARVRRIYLCGGGARVHNLDRYLAAELNVEVKRATMVSEALAPVLPVDQWAEGTDMTHAAKALAYALSGFAAGKSERLDFRQGEFAYRGDFEFLEGRAPQLVAGLLVVSLLLGFNGYARYFDITRQESQVVARQQETCKSILGQEVKSAERCLAMMNEQIRPSGEGAGVPTISAIDPYLEVARSTPEGVSVKVDELEIGIDRVRIKGTTDSFESVDKIVTSMQKGHCFHNVQRGPARQTGDKVGYSVTLDVDCSLKPAAVEALPGPDAPPVDTEVPDKEG